MPLWLIGMMGSGKTVVAQELAEMLATTMIDLDSFVEDAAGSSISEIWREGGEETFRLLEERAVEEVADLADAVVATGGGVVLRADNVEVMRHSGAVVWLRAEPEVLAARIGGADKRPLLSGSHPTKDRLTSLLADRTPLYQQAADLAFFTDELGVAEIATEIAQWLRRR